MKKSSIFIITAFGVLFLNNCTKPESFNEKVLPLVQNSLAADSSTDQFNFQSGPSTAANEALAAIIPAANHFIDHKNDHGLIIAAVAPDGVAIRGLGALDGLSDLSEQYMEIGSLTKGFVGLTMAALVNEGTITPDTPLAKCLPPEVKIPAADKITFGMLTTHTAGIPRLPQKIADNAERPDPYAAFTAADLWQSLAQDSLNSPGSYEYSNFGAAVLGAALANCAGEKSWEELLDKKVNSVLGLKGITTKAQKALIQGHNEKLEPSAAWNFKAMAPAGALKANIMELAKLAQMMVAPQKFNGKNIIKVATIPLHKASLMESMNGFQAIGMNWHLGVGILKHLFVKEGNAELMNHLIWHNGQTGSAASSMAILPEKKIAVVVLSDTSSESPHLISLFGLGLFLGEDEAVMKQGLENVTKKR